MNSNENFIKDFFLSFFISKIFCIYQIIIISIKLAFLLLNAPNLDLYYDILSL